MLVGQENRFFDRFEEGEFVYVHCYFDMKNAYQSKVNDSGYGVIVDTSYIESSPEYLLPSTLVGVFINGKINWYSPHEILRINSRNVSKHS
jgi:hypothetical protein